MIHTLIISLLIEKPFYLLRPQSFSFQIVSESIDIFMKFSDILSRGGGGLLPSSHVPGGWFWMKFIPALQETIWVVLRT